MNPRRRSTSSSGDPSNMRSKDSFSVFSGSLRTLYPPSSASQPRNPWNFTWGRSVILVLAHSAPPEPRPNPVRPITALFSMLPTNKGTKRHVDNSSTSTIRSMRPQEAFRAWPMRPLITCCLRSRDSSYHNSSQDSGYLLSGSQLRVTEPWQWDISQTRSSCSSSSSY